MDHRLLALLEPPKVGKLRKLYRSYFGQPIGQHALNPLPRKPYTMPDGLRYRIRAAALRPKRETQWTGFHGTHPITERCLNAQCPTHFPKETTSERLGLPTTEDTSEPSGVCSG